MIILSKYPLLIDTAETVLIGMALFIISYIFIAQPNRVDGESMATTLHTNDYIVTEKISYRFEAPQRGDIVVVDSPTDSSKELIKRIIALPGEELTLKEDGVYIVNGEHPDSFRLQEPYLNTGYKTRGDKAMQLNTTYTLESDEYLVMGDNREHSADSRFFGPVKRSALVGRALMRYWPLGKLSFFGS